MKKEQTASDEAVLDVSKRLIEQNQQAYEDLAGRFNFNVSGKCSNTKDVGYVHVRLTVFSFDGR